jgi:hypothetical protein
LPTFRKNENIKDTEEVSAEVLEPTKAKQAALNETRKKSLVKANSAIISN